MIDICTVDHFKGIAITITLVLPSKILVITTRNKDKTKTNTTRKDNMIFCCICLMKIGLVQVFHYEIVFGLVIIRYNIYYTSSNRKSSTITCQRAHLQFGQ